MGAGKNPIAKRDTFATRLFAATLFVTLGLVSPHQVWADDSPPKPSVPTAIQVRLQMEKAAHDNPFLILPHRPSYILPFAYNDGPNDAADPANGLDRMEMKFQVSLKILLREGLVGDRGNLYMGYTNQSWWQVFNEDMSRPFRETNHEPELFALFDIDENIFGWRASSVSFGVNHHSNGQGVATSRSWNRIFAEVVLERGDLFLSLRPWYRVPEHRKSSPSDPTGDDNPDIAKYYGYGQVNVLYRGGGNRFTIMGRNNLRSENRGAIEVGWTFPLSSKVKGYMQYFNGYGESLIDYNVRVNRLGLGFLLADWL